MIAWTLSKHNLEKTMQPEMSPETTVLVEYANENLQLKIENARLRSELQKLTPAEDAPTSGE